MGHVATARPPPQPVDMFVSDEEPTNIIHYIHQYHITNEHNLYSSVPMNIWPYVHRPYIHQLVCQLTDEYMTNSLV
jgi:hypothetical protein